MFPACCPCKPPHRHDAFSGHVCLFWCARSRCAHAATTSHGHLAYHQPPAGEIPAASEQLHVRPCPPHSFDSCTQLLRRARCGLLRPPAQRRLQPGPLARPCHPPAPKHLPATPALPPYRCWRHCSALQCSCPCSPGIVIMRGGCSLRRVPLARPRSPARLLPGYPAAPHSPVQPCCGTRPAAAWAPRPTASWSSPACTPCMRAGTAALVPAHGARLGPACCVLRAACCVLHAWAGE
jgi:hypothetical protein